MSEAAQQDERQTAKQKWSWAAFFGALGVAVVTVAASFGLIALLYEVTFSSNYTDQRCIYPPPPGYYESNPIDPWSTNCALKPISQWSTPYTLLPFASWLFFSLTLGLYSRVLRLRKPWMHSLIAGVLFNIFPALLWLTATESDSAWVWLILLGLALSTVYSGLTLRPSQENASQSAEESS